MRCYQEIGLTEEARKWLEENAVRDHVCPLCKRDGYEKGILKEISEEYVNLFYGNGPNLKTYELKDGGKVCEVIQTEPWSSGPMAFLCLEKEDKTRLFEWTEEEVREYF